MVIVCWWCVMKMACPHYSFIDISPSFFNVMFSPSEFLAIAWLPCVCQWFPRFHDSCISPLCIIAFCCDHHHTPNYIEASDKWNHQVAELCIQTYLQASFPKPRGDRASPMAEARIHDLYLTPLASTKSFVRASLCVCICVCVSMCACEMHLEESLEERYPSSGVLLGNCSLTRLDRCVPASSCSTKQKV